MKIIAPDSSRAPRPLTLDFLLILFLFIGTFITFYYFSRPMTIADLEILNSENAEILKSQTETWTPAVSGMKLSAGDEIRTGPFGRVDITGQNFTLRAEEYSQLRMRPALRMFPFYRFQFNRGSLFLRDAGQKIRITVPLSFAPRITGKDEVLCDLLFFLQLSIHVGDITLSVTQDTQAASLSVFKNSAEVRFKAIWRQFTAFNNNKILFYQQDSEVDTLPLTADEKMILEEALTKVPVIRPQNQGDSTKKNSNKINVPLPSSESELDSEILLTAAKSFHSKSSSAFVRLLNEPQQSPDLHFEYMLPNPDCQAGFHLPAQSTTPLATQSSRRNVIKGFKVVMSKDDFLPSPAQIRLEIRSNERVLRAVPIKLSQAPGWQTFELATAPIQRDTVTEIAFVVSYAKAGGTKKGGFKLRGFSFLP